MSRDRVTQLVVYIVAGIVLILLSQSFQTDVSLLALTFGLLAAITFIGTILDPRCKNYIRAALHVTSFIFLICCVLGMMVQKDWFTLDRYCVLFGILGIIKGSVKLVESLYIFKDKNKMAFLFLADSLFEIVIGVLMCIEVSEALRMHVILIGGDAIYEGIIKFINEYFEEKQAIANKTE